MSLTTAQQWWDLVGAKRALIIAIAEKEIIYGRLDGDPPWLWAGPGDATPQKQDQSLAAAFNQSIWKKNTNFTIWFLHAIWLKAPDAPIIHTWEGWDTICDLCSESYLVQT